MPTAGLGMWVIVRYVITPYGIDDGWMDGLNYLSNRVCLYRLFFFLLSLHACLYCTISQNLRSSLPSSFLSFIVRRGWRCSRPALLVLVGIIISSPAERRNMSLPLSKCLPTYVDTYIHNLNVCRKVDGSCSSARLVYLVCSFFLKMHVCIRK